jgi:hypothetical protein
MELMARVGFEQVDYVGATGVMTSDATVGTLFRARKP